MVFQKLVIADNLGLFVDPIYSESGEYGAIALLTASFLFALQIYFDFSAYSDIARGLAKTLGINLIRNFDSPYFATSIRDFWRKWHISLTTWFRDYVYIPLGGSRQSRSTTISNVLTVFLLSGFWHGANWTFIVWGLIHGVAFLAELSLRKILTNFGFKLPTGIHRYFYTFFRWSLTMSIVLSLDFLQV